VRHRHYAPDLGRWLSRDPLGYVDGMSLYEYVGSYPMNITDPSGLCWSACGKCLIDLGLGASSARYLVRFFRAIRAGRSIDKMRRGARRGLWIDGVWISIDRLFSMPSCVDCYTCLGGRLPTYHLPPDPIHPVRDLAGCLQCCDDNRNKARDRCFDDYTVPIDHPCYLECSDARGWCLFKTGQDHDSCRHGCFNGRPCRSTAIPSYYQDGGPNDTGPYDPSNCQ
jgi:hypothetical protein